MLEVCFAAGVTREDLTIGRLPEAMGHLERGDGLGQFDDEAQGPPWRIRFHRL